MYSPMYKFFLFLLTLGVFALSSFAALAQERSTSSLPIQEWSKLPILHEGRLKPLDSFARLHLKRFSGRETIQGISAAEWLADSIFLPEQALYYPIFKIRAISNQTSFVPDKDGLYSYDDLMKALQPQQETITELIKAKPSDLTAEQKYLLEIYHNTFLYAELLRSMTALLPITVEKEDLPGYWLHKDKKQSPAVKKALQAIKTGGESAFYFQILPQNWNKKDGDWNSPWVYVTAPLSNPQSDSYLTLWASMADAYRQGNHQHWNETIDQAQSLIGSTRLAAEYYYNVFNLSVWAIILFFVSFSFVIGRSITQKPLFIPLTFISYIFALGATILDISLRIYILQRPPVGTLYESILFVSLVCGLSFLLWEKSRKDTSGLLLGSISCGLLLIVSRGFTGDDTMNTLVAVLNTNFWLLTHVITITIGYGVCFLASFLAHYYLIGRAFKTKQTSFLTSLFSATRSIVLLGLLFTTIGTILGGIWADQSWGRFWGWDPKENGALLIVLWLVWIVHGRITKHLDEIHYVMATAATSIIVVLAWFGVNLLNVGLHSYGFITGVALGIGLFCLTEILLIGGLYIMIKHKESTV